MDAEVYKQPGRRRANGLVDRLYADELGADLEPLPESKWRQEAQDPYAQEVGPGAGIMRGLNDWLGENVVEPAARAGYPNAGAAAATVPSVLADLVVPQTGADYAGALVPFGKVGKALKGEAKLAGEVGSAENKMMSKQDIVDMDDINYSKMKRDFLANAPDVARSGKVLTKEELAAKRMAENQEIIEASKRPVQGVAEESEPIRSGTQDLTDKIARLYNDRKAVSETGGHLGSDASVDPFRWSDTKNGASKEILRAHKGKPLKISTTSDLIAHDDYISQLDPKLHSVEFRLTPDVSFDELLSLKEYSGRPSFKRQAKAIKKLRDAGIDVRVIDAPEKPLDELSAMRSLGFVPKRSGQ